jgi:hypothetical protein
MNTFPMLLVAVILTSNFCRAEDTGQTPASKSPVASTNTVSAQRLPD